MARPITWASALCAGSVLCGGASPPLPLVYVNMTGGNDQLVFDGSSFCVDGEGEIVAAAKSFDEDIVLFDTATLRGDRHDNLGEEIEAVYEALVMGTRDYLRNAASSAC